LHFEFSLALILAPEECRQASDVAEVVALSLPEETPNVHVVDQPLAQRANGCVVGDVMVRLLIEEARHALPLPLT
jgi:hypothetical protein